MKYCVLHYVLMIERYTERNLTWIDLVNPSADEIREVMEEADLPPTYVNDLASPIPRSFAIGEKNLIKLTFDIPIVKRTDINHPHEVKVLATKTHLISVHFEEIEAIHRFKKEFEMLSILKSTKKQATGAHLLVALIGFLYDALTVKLDYLESRLSDIEQEIFNEHEKEMVFEISEVNRRIITFNHVLASHGRVLEELEIIIASAFTKDLAIAVHAISNQYRHLIERISTINETVTELRETNMALLNTKQNEIMKILTIMAFITFPLTLFTSMFGMNTIATPIVGTPGDFWIILGTMGFVSIGFFVYFKYKRWM